MNDNQVKARLKGTAWLLVSLIGMKKTIEYLKSLITEIEETKWEGAGDK